VDLGGRLGSSEPAATSQFTVFIPSVDRDGIDIDQLHWREEVLGGFGRLFGGATAFPPGKGVWRDDERGGQLQYDDTIIITSYIDPALLENDAILDGLYELLHRLGSGARQGAVAFVVDDQLFKITEFHTS
jgi:hypothetical protein